MYRNISIIIGLIYFTSCSQNKPVLEEQIAVAVKEPSKIKKEVSTIKVEPKTEPKVVTDFVPEHIKRSKIEVVEHY